MPRGSYQVQEQQADFALDVGHVANNGVVSVDQAKQVQRDTSFRSCAQAMGIFIAVCFILILIFYPYKKASTDDHTDLYGTDKHSGGPRGNSTSTSTTSSTSTRFTTTTAATIKTLPGVTTTSASTTKTSPGVTTTAAITTKTSPRFTTVASSSNSVTENDSSMVTSKDQEATTTDFHVPTLSITTTFQIARKPIYSVTPDYGNTATVTEVTDASSTRKSTKYLSYEQSDSTVANIESTTDVSANTESTTDVSANTESTTHVSVNTESTTVVSANTESTTHVSANTESTTHVSANTESATDVSGNTESTTHVSANTESTTDVSVNTESSTDVSANTESTTNVSAIVKQTTILTPTLISSGPTNEIDETKFIYPTLPPRPTSEKLTQWKDSTSSWLTSPTDPDSKTCTSPQCKIIASRMISLMNHSVSPCSDFYEYSCGGLGSNKALIEIDPYQDVCSRIREEMSLVNDSTNNEAYVKFKNFYNKCMSFEEDDNPNDRKANVLSALEELGQSIDNTSIPAVDFTDLIANLMLAHSAPLFDVLLDVDGQNSSRFALKITLPVFESIFKRDVQEQVCKKADMGVTDMNAYYEAYKKCSIGAYLDEVENTVKSLYDDRRDLGASVKFSIDEKILYLDPMGEKEVPSVEDKRIKLITKKYDEVSIGELGKTIGNFIDWKRLLAKLLDVTEGELDEKTLVQVYFKDVIKEKLDSLVTKEDDVLKIYRALVAIYAHELYHNIGTPYDKCTRSDSCLRIASDLMEDVSSSLYVSSFKPSELNTMEKDVEEVFKEVKMTLESLLYHNTSHWIDNQFRSDALNKLQSLKLVNNGVVFNNHPLLQERMVEIPLYPTDYISHSILLLKRNRKLMYSLYNVNPSDSKAIWSQFSLPHSTEASTIYGINTIVIPYGQLSWPFYETDVPRYLRMARIGFILAHEISHHFDTVGITYPKGKGKDDGIISDDVKETITKYQDCWHMKYGRPSTEKKPNGKDVKFKLKPELSLNERIADSGALTLSHETFMHSTEKHEKPLPWLGLNNEQLYFISMAQGFCSKSSILDHGVSLFEDEHLPPVLRVQDIVENSKTFLEVFGCADGEMMKLVERCDVFPLLTN